MKEKKRDIFEELMEGIDALRDSRNGGIMSKDKANPKDLLGIKKPPHSPYPTCSIGP